jgi:hypothetical protein
MLGCWMGWIDWIKVRARRERYNNRVSRAWQPCATTRPARDWNDDINLLESKNDILLLQDPVRATYVVITFSDYSSFTREASQYSDTNISNAF